MTNGTFKTVVQCTHRSHSGSHAASANPVNRDPELFQRPQSADLRKRSYAPAAEYHVVGSSDDHPRQTSDVTWIFQTKMVMFVRLHPGDPSSSVGMRLPRTGMDH